MSIIKYRKRIVTILQYQLPVTRQGAYFSFGGSADSRQILQRQSWKINYPLVYHWSYAIREVWEIHKAFKQNKVLIKASTFLKIT